MQIYPAIDLKDGACVRLKLGKMEEATMFNADPIDQALRFQEAGAKWLHVVDLNGAFAGHSMNGKAVKDILQHTDLNIQLGGGIRNMQAADYWLEAGVSRIILGTSVIKNKEFAYACCRKHPRKVVLGLDGHHGRLAISGWSEETDIMVEDVAQEFCREFTEGQVAAIIHTDIDRDGVMAGANLYATEHLATIQEIPVIASGGISSMDDVKALAKIQKLDGMIIGRALYENAIDLASAIAYVKNL